MCRERKIAYFREEIYLLHKSIAQLLTRSNDSILTATLSSLAPRALHCQTENIDVLRTHNFVLLYVDSCFQRLTDLTRTPCTTFESVTFAETIRLQAHSWHRGRLALRWRYGKRSATVPKLSVGSRTGGFVVIHPCSSFTILVFFVLLRFLSVLPSPKKTPRVSPLSEEDTVSSSHGKEHSKRHDL